MIHGGNTTVLVSDIQASISFYTEVLGLSLRTRVGDDWAEIDAGGGLIIGLHPASPHAPSPGTSGAMSIGLNVTEKLESVMEVLSGRGVMFEGSIQEDGNVRLASFSDRDGNPLYLAQVLHPGALGGSE